VSRAELIYPIRERIEKELAKAERDPHNAEILKRYFKVKSGQVSAATALENIIRLNVISKILNKKFEEASVQDIEDLVYKIDQRNNSDATKNKFRSILKIFYRWLRGYPKTEYPPEVRWISRKKVPLVAITSQDLITYDEAIRISEFAQNLRDKALFQCKVDAGCRIGEILTPKISEVQFNDAGAVLFSDGKTGYQPIILTWAARTLAQWLNIHPFRNDPNAPVFCLLTRAKPVQMSYAAATRAFKKCTSAAGIKKRVWLHLLKHVSCTEDSVRGMPDSYRKYKHHWSANSRMPAVYEHLSQSLIPKIQNETWKVMGVHEKTIQEEKPVQVIKLCSRCQYENPRDSKFCNRCAFQLDGKAAELAITRKRLDELLDKLTKNPETLEKLTILLKS
jgi:site-specific recombinase XerD